MLEVITSLVNQITPTSAVLGGNTAWDAGANFSERGIVYSSMNTNPEIGGANVIQDTNGSGLGIFSKTISNLITDTVYYVRAYGMNTNGITYGNIQTFSTTNIGLKFNSGETFGVNGHANFDFSTNGFTIEGWFKFDDFATSQLLFFSI